MQVSHSHRATWLRSAVALSMAAVLLCGMLGSGLHVLMVEHVWCQTHAAVEHGGAHDVGHAETHAQSPEEAPEDHEQPGDQDCDLHFWMHNTSVPVPPIHASLLDLPPPSAGLELPDAVLDASTHQPIEILHVSPGLSPPSGLA